MTYTTPVEIKSQWLLGTANNLHAFRAVRSAAVSVKPAEPDTAQQAAGPGAVVVAAPPTRAASARAGARR